MKKDTILEKNRVANQDIDECDNMIYYQSINYGVAGMLIVFTILSIVEMFLRIELPSLFFKRTFDIFFIISCIYRYCFNKKKLDLILAIGFTFTTVSLLICYILGI